MLALLFMIDWLPTQPLILPFHEQTLFFATCRIPETRLTPARRSFATQLPFVQYFLSFESSNNKARAANFG